MMPLVSQDDRRPLTPHLVEYHQGSLHEIVRDMEKARDVHPYWENSLFRACQSGTLTLDDFRFLFSQYYVYSKNFTRYLLALTSKLDDEVQRAQILLNLHDEGGGGTSERRHTQLYRNFLERGLLISLDSIVVHDSTANFVRSYLEYCNGADPLAVSAFLSLGTEGIVARSYKIFSDSLRRAGIKDEHLEFFHVHMECDDDHAATLQQIMMSFSDTPRWQETCRAAMNHALDLRTRFFESLFNIIQYRRIQRIVENIDARESMLAETKQNEGFGGLHADMAQPAPVLYANQVERLNIEFTVHRLPFKGEVLDPRVVRIPPGKFNEKHKHAHETVFYYLQGSGRVLVDDEAVDVKQGDVVFVPRWAVHQSQNLGKEEMVILAITDYGLTGKAFMGNYYRVSRTKEDLFQKYSIVEQIDRAFWADPYPVLQRARRESPVFYSETFDAWFLTRYSDIDRALRDPRLSSRRATFKFAGLTPDLREEMRPFECSMGQWMIFNDAPDHTRLRGACSRMFSPKFVQSMRPRIEAVVNELIDASAARGHMDVMRDVASPLPGVIVAEMLGVTGSDRRKFEKWSDDIAAFAGASETRRELATAALQSWRAMTACIAERVEDRRRHPQDDFLTSLLAVADPAARLTDEELLSTCVVLLAAGHGATQDTVCNSLLTLLRHPEALAEVRANPDLLDTTGMDELLRYESALQLASRVALEDLVIDGHEVRKGQRVMAMLGAANRDPEVFPDPDRLDLHRKNNRHMAFGVGPHFCIGGPLGRLEGIVTVNALLKRLPSIRLATDALEWRTRISFRGVQALPVTF